MGLTKAQEQWYLARGGMFCPFCCSSQICGDSIEVDGARARQYMTCADCRRGWEDVYTLTGIAGTDDRDEPASRPDISSPEEEAAMIERQELLARGCGLGVGDIDAGMGQLERAYQWLGETDKTRRANR